MSSFPTPDPNALQQRLQQIAQTPLQPVPPAGPDQGANPIKRFLTNFFYGGGQAALQHVGLPTDYEKQQQVIQQNDRQQQINQQAAQTGALIQYHQAQTAATRAKAAQDAEYAKVVPVGEGFGKIFGVDPNTMLPQGAIRDAIYKHITTPPHERAPLSTPQGYFNLDASGHATPILGPDNKPLMPSSADKLDTPEQQFLQEYAQKHPGAPMSEGLRAYTLVTQKPAQATPINLIVTGPDGKPVVQTYHGGQAVGPNAQTPSQYGQTPDKLQKVLQPFDAALANSEDAHRYAAMQNGTGDAALVLRYVDAIKPDKGFRLTNTELGMMVHSRSFLGNVDALLAKVNSGALLTPEQRQDMLSIVDMKAGHAKQMRESIMHRYQQYAGGDDPGTPGAPASSTPAASNFSDFAKYKVRK